MDMKKKKEFTYDDLSQKVGKDIDDEKILEDADNVVFNEDADLRWPSGSDRTARDWIRDEVDKANWDSEDNPWRREAVRSHEEKRYSRMK